MVFLHTGQRPAADQSDSDQDDVCNESSIKSTPSGCGSPLKTVHKKQKKHKGTSGNSRAYQITVGHQVTVGIR